MANDTQAKLGILLSLLSLVVSILPLFVGTAVAGWIVIDPDGFVEAVVEKLSESERGLLTKDVFNGRMEPVDASLQALEEAVASRLATEKFRRRIAELEGTIENRSCCAEGSTTASNPRIEVLFDNARLQPRKSGGSAAQRLTENSPGIALTASQEAELDKLAAALRACAAPGTTVRLKIQGYSSTQPFVATGGLLDDSDELNVMAANLRAKAVSDRLASQGIDKDGGFDVQRQQWLAYGDMERPFLDSHGSFQGTAQEQLNRVVFVELEDAGACQRDA